MSDEKQQMPLHVSVKQTAKGEYYLGSASVNAFTLEEIDIGLSKLLVIVTEKIKKLNQGPGDQD